MIVYIWLLAQQFVSPSYKTDEYLYEHRNAKVSSDCVQSLMHILHLRQNLYYKAISFCQEDQPFFAARSCSRFSIKREFILNCSGEGDSFLLSASSSTW